MEITEIPAQRYDTGKGFNPVKEWVVSEKKYQIFINKTEIALISGSPDMVRELAVGYLVGGGFLNLDDITTIEVSENTVYVACEKPADVIVKHMRSSDCSSHWISEIVAKEKIVQSSLAVPAEVILHSVSQLQSDTQTWKKTHAVHSAGLFSGCGDVKLLVEDISRHNAFDKIVGKALLEKYDVSSAFVALSGRITQDMVIKAGNVGIPLIASRSTVIEPAVTVASALGICVIGYTRGQHLVVFSHPERVRVEG